MKPGVFVTVPPATPPPIDAEAGSDKIPGKNGDGHPPPPPPPDKGGGIVGVVPGEGAEPAPLVGAALSAGAGADAGSTRAAAVAGAMFGILAAASGLAWALYKFKPGIIPLGGAGAGRAGAAAPSAAAPLLGSPGAAPTGSGPPVGAPAVTPVGSAPPPDGPGFSPVGSSSPLGAGPGPEARDVGTMAAAGYRSSGASGAGGAYARGFGILETSQTFKMTESTAAVGSAGAPASPTSTMNRGIQTDVANGPIGGAGLAAAGGASSSTLMQSTTVKNLYSTQQADSSYLDGSVLLFILFFI